MLLHGSGFSQGRAGRNELHACEVLDVKREGKIPLEMWIYSIRC
jgi:hypothetical protein